MLICLKDGSKTRKSLLSLTNSKSRTLDQRLQKLIRYGYIHRPNYGHYALTKSGEEKLKEFEQKIEPEVLHKRLNKIISKFPIHLQTFLRLLISGVIAKQL